VGPTASKKQTIFRKAGSIGVKWPSGIPNEWAGLAFTHRDGSECGFPVRRAEVRKLADALTETADELEGTTTAKPASARLEPRHAIFRARAGVRDGSEWRTALARVGRWA